MNRFFTLLLAASCLTAVGQVPDYVPTNGLEAWLQFNGNAIDESLNGHDGEVDGAILTVDRFGNESSAYQFDGDDRIFPANPETFPLAERTTSIWLKSNAGAENGRTVFGYGGNGCGSSWLLTYNNQGNQPFSEDAFELQGHCNAFATAAAVPVEELESWHNVVLRTSSSGTDIFIDGVLLIHTEGFVDNTMPGCAVLGATPDPSGNCVFQDESNELWVGVLDDFGVWNRALTNDEVLGLYLAPAPVLGCMNQEACNFDANATLEDGSCVPCDVATAFCGPGTTWDAAMQMCVVSNPSDSNFDGCVQLNDLLDLLSAYGDCGVEEEDDALWSCGDPLEFQGYDYQTVQVGNQCWFAENLRGTNYLNGDSIPLSALGDDWTELDDGAQCYYGDNPEFLDTYGRLYNWYAVADGRGVCPAGWHAPDFNEFQNLKNFISENFEDYSVAQVLKSIDWSGADLAGFSALAGGYRVDGSTGFYDGIWGFTGFWTTSPEDPLRGWHFRIQGDFAGLNSNNGYGYGFSVRCLRDAE